MKQLSILIIFFISNISVFAAGGNPPPPAPPPPPGANIDIYLPILILSALLLVFLIKKPNKVTS